MSSNDNNNNSNSIISQNLMLTLALKQNEGIIRNSNCSIDFSKFQRYVFLYLSQLFLIICEECQDVSP